MKATRFYRLFSRMLIIFTVISLLFSTASMESSLAAVLKSQSGKMLRADSSTAVKKIQLKDQKVTIVVNEQYKLYVKVSPASAGNQPIYWTSSDTSIASVNSSGVVTGIKKGVVTITAMSENGVSASCTVEVTGSSEIKEIRLKDSSITIKLSEQYKLYVSVNPANAPDQTITWTSSDSSVASVDDNGIVTGKANGKATVTARSVNGKTASCTVTVKGEIAVQKIKVQYSKLNMVPGQTVKVSYAISPKNANKNVTWSSSDSKIAIVDSKGNVTAKSKGTTVISVKSHNGKTASCTVEVKDPSEQTVYDVAADFADSVAEEMADIQKGNVYEVTSIELSADAPMALGGAINILGRPVRMTAKCLPINSDQTVIWSSSNPGVASVSSDGIVTPRGYGAAMITATSSNGLKQSVPVSVAKDNKFTKTINHTNEIISYVKSFLKFVNHDPWGITTLPLSSVEWSDYVEIHVDGLTGKINEKNVYASQDVKGLRIGVFVNFSKNTIKASYVSPDYVDFISQASLSLGIGVGEVKGDLDFKTYTYRYRMDNQGNFTQLK